MKKFAAYTLLETLIVLSIVSILMSLTILSLQSTLNQENANILESQLITAIETAEQSARANFSPVIFCPSNNHSACSTTWLNDWIVFIDKEEKAKVEDAGQIISLIQPNTKHGQLYWRAFPQYRGYLLFLPKTLTTSDNGTFWYCRERDKSPAWALVLNKSGRTRKVAPDKYGNVKDSQGNNLSCE